MSDTGTGRKHCEMHAFLHMYTHIHMFVQTYLKIRARYVGVCFDKALHFQAGNTNPESLCAAVKPGKSQQSAISDITSGGEAHITDETTEIMQLGICSSMLSEVLLHTEEDGGKAVWYPQKFSQRPCVQSGTPLRLLRWVGLLVETTSRACPGRTEHAGLHEISKRSIGKMLVLG